MSRAKEVQAILKRWKTDSRMESFSNIERSFGLPQRTLESWLSGEAKPGAGALPLLKMLDTFPWLILVAVRGFEEKAAKKIMAIAGLEAVQDKLIKELG